MQLLVGLQLVDSSLVPVYANVNVINGRLIVQSVDNLNPDDVEELNLTETVTNIVTGGGGGIVGIVASAKVLNSSTGTPTTNLYTVPTDGLYRISANAVTTGATIGSITFHVDSVNAGSIFSTAVSGTSPCTSPNNPIVLTLVAGDVLTYDVGYSQGTYSFYTTVELLLS